MRESSRGSKFIIHHLIDFTPSMLIDGVNVTLYANEG